MSSNLASSHFDNLTSDRQRNTFVGYQMKVPQTKKSFEAIKSHIIELERPEQILSLIEIIQACCNGMALYILMDDVARQVDKIAAALCVTVYGETVRKRAETLVLLQQRMPC